MRAVIIVDSRSIAPAKKSNKISIEDKVLWELINNNKRKVLSESG